MLAAPSYHHSISFVELSPYDLPGKPTYPTCSNVFPTLGCHLRVLPLHYIIDLALSWPSASFPTPFRQDPLSSYSSVYLPIFLSELLGHADSGVSIFYPPALLLIPLGHFPSLCPQPKLSSLESLTVLSLPKTKVWTQPSLSLDFFVNFKISANSRLSPFAIVLGSLFLGFPLIMASNASVVGSSSDTFHLFLTVLWGSDPNPHYPPPANCPFEIVPSINADNAHFHFSTTEFTNLKQSYISTCPPDICVLHASTSSQPRQMTLPNLHELELNDMTAILQY